VLPHLRVLGPVAVSGMPPLLDVLQLLLDDATLNRRAVAKARVARAEMSMHNGRRRVRYVKRAANTDTTDAAADDAGASASADRSDRFGQQTNPQRRARSPPATEDSRVVVTGDDAATLAVMNGACQSGLAAATDPPLSLVAAVAAAKSVVADLSYEGDSVATVTSADLSPQLRELHIAGPVTRDELAAVTRAFPRLRVLQCEYGGPCPLDAPSLDSSAPPRDLTAAETAFIEWLGAVKDDCTNSATTPSAAALRPPVPQLRELRRLRVARPPFDGERDAAAMGALEALRAHSHVLIEFVHRPPVNGY
jgi:hypothetical protein